MNAVPEVPEPAPGDALGALRWAMDGFPRGKLALACSFGAEDMVLLELCAELGRFPRIVTLDTGRLPQQTYDLMERARRRYGVDFEAYFPEAGEVEDMTRSHGPNLFYASPELRRLCCRVRKVGPLRRALAGCGAWITGLRREQSPSRARVRVVEQDPEFGLLKVNPLADWTQDQVWELLRARGAPYNALHDAGYPSIGCAPCTRAVAPGEDPRSGRWWWEQSTRKECGLHR